MTKERFIELIDTFPNGTEFLVRHGGILKRPILNYEVINDSHFDKFPFFIPEEEVKALLGKHVIVIE
jgi:hypothetical protein